MMQKHAVLNVTWNVLKGAQMNPIKILSKVIIFSLITVPAFADQSVDVKAGQKVPYDGTLLDLEKARNKIGRAHV